MTLSRRTIGTAFFAFIAALATGMATLALFTAPAKAAPAGFVQRCGIHFCLNGKAYYFAGANTYDLGDDVADADAAARPEHARDLGQHRGLVGREVDHAVRDHHVDR